jgi:colanic acid biosynthesis glycosyl transferase WcaI
MQVADVQCSVPHSAGASTILVLSQVYVPDHAAVGQCMHDAAAELVRRGNQVDVLTSQRGYEDPTCKYPSRETLDGVRIRRLPLSSFGKSSIMARLIGGMLFVAQCIIVGLFTQRLGAILVSTSPPMCPLAALIVGRIRRVPVKYWAMDLNPDQLVVMGKIAETSLFVRAFNLLNRATLKHSEDVIALDACMASRLNAKVDVSGKMTVMPPWTHADAERPPIAHDDNPFRKEHQFGDRIVIMYSGNISPSHPITTILDAAVKLQDTPDFLFVFIGGGLGRASIEDAIRCHQLKNVLLLPYQPLDQIQFSLSAADVHLVSVGNDMVGIVHPCKVYGAMAVGRPILLLGPRQSHVGEILDQADVGWQVSHGDLDGAVSALHRIRLLSVSERELIGQNAQRLVREKFDPQRLKSQFCEVVEYGLPRAA